MSDELLFELLFKTPVTERGALLDHECADQPERRQKIDSLLKAQGLSSTLPDELETTTGFTPTASYPSADPSAGVIIAGRYTLEQKLGEGGMGEVWVARQTEPVKRKVALKLIKAGMDSKSVVQRFEQERQALALMDHPNIAKVLDGGIDNAPLPPNPSPAGGEGRRTGRPFFVMELVQGSPLTRFCDDARLGIRERLELFVPICQAVQHAHQKGIVHRDLKPGNILVMMVDGKPVPKVIDFGVAKATAGKLTDESMGTQFGAVIGTLEYMSPEQAGFASADIDTRADIYSLGIVLYELLTGLRPFDHRRLKKAALDELIRIIREEEPSKPSTRLSSADSLPSLAAVRLIEPKRLTALLRGELDWVVMKCLEKQRDRRYETANGLARDIQRFLADEAVEARPPSTGYRFGKFLKRNKGPVLAGALVVLALVGGIVGTSIGLIRAERARANEEKQRTRAETVASFMQTTLEGAGPAVAKGRDSKLLKEMMDEAAGRIAAGQLDANPEAEAQLRATIGNVYMAVAEYERAELHLRRSALLANELFGTGDSRFENVNLDLSLCLLYRGSYEECKAIAQTVLAECGKWGHADSEQAAMAWDLVGQADYNLTGGDLIRAEQAHRRSLEIRRRIHPPGAARIARSLQLIAFDLNERHQYDEAEPICREAYEICRKSHGSLNTETIIISQALADILIGQDKIAQAEELMRETLRHAETLYGPQHRTVGDVLWRLGNSLYHREDYQAAEPFHARCLAIRRQLYSGHHKDIASALAALARNKYRLGNGAAAEPLVQEALEMRRALFGADSAVVASSLDDLGECLSSMGKSAESCKAYAEALEIWRKTRPASKEYAHTVANLGLEKEKLGDLTTAVKLFRENLECETRRLGTHHREVVVAHTHLGACLFRLGNKNEAVEQLRKAVEIGRLVQGLESIRSLSRYGNLAFILEDRGDYVGAEPLHREFADKIRKLSVPNEMALAGILTRLTDNLMKQRKPVDAEPVIRECLALRMKQTPDGVAVLNMKAFLGESLLAQKKYTEAEPLLVSGYEGMKKQEARLPPPLKPRLRVTLDRLIQLYTETSKPDEVKKWQAEKE